MSSRRLLIGAAAAAGLAAGAWQLSRRGGAEAERLVRELAAEMVRDADVLARHNTDPRKSYSELLDSTFRGLVAITLETGDDGRLRRAWLPDLSSLPIDHDQVARYLDRRGGGCAALPALGFPAAAAGRLDAWFCEKVGRQVAVFALAAERLSGEALEEVRLRQSLPALFSSENELPFPWVLSLRYARRQSGTRGGSAGSDWGGTGAGRLDAAWTALFERHGLLLWRQAAKETPPQEGWVTGRAMADAIAKAFPWARRGDEVLFFPKGRRPLVVPAEASRTVRDGRKPWELLQRYLDQLPGGGSMPKALSPYAAEELVELVTAMAMTQTGAGPGIWDGSFLPVPPDLPTRKPLFREIPAPQSGLPAAGRPMPPSEMGTYQMPGGLAVLDYDRDGRPDLFLCGYEQARLFRNKGGFRFEDVTDAAGLRGLTCFQGASSADYDNDGWPDLLALHDRQRRDRLLRNEKGRFRDVGAELGLSTGPAQTMTAVWLDYDRDGRLDLYLLEYGDFRFMERVPPEGDSRNALPKLLYHQRSDGRFEEVAAKAGVADTHWGLPGVSFDYDDDGWPDIVLDNDFGRIVLYRNMGDGTFRDMAEAAGLRALGNGMGISAGDFDRDGKIDLFLTYVGGYRPEARHLFPDAHPLIATQPIEKTMRQRPVLYRNKGGGVFEDVSLRSLEQVASGWAWNGFFFDAANSGRDDIFLVNGWWLNRLFYREEAKVFWRWNPRESRYMDISEESGLGFSGVSRVSGYADFDGDGCLDVLATGFHRPRLFAGDCPRSNHWLEVRLEGVRSNRDGIGARVTARAGDLTQTTEMGTQGGGFQSSLLRAARFGLGERSRVDSLAVRWPSGIRQTVGPLGADRSVVVREAEALP